MSNLNPEDLSIKQENKDDNYQTVIERKNLTNEFTVADIVTHLKTLHRMKREVDATVSLAEKMVDNIERKHMDLLKNLSDEERSHVWLWQENANIIKEGKPKQAEIDEEIAKHDGYVDVVCETFKWERPNTANQIEHKFVPKKKAAKKK